MQHLVEHTYPILCIKLKIHFGIFSSEKLDELIGKVNVFSTVSFTSIDPPSGLTTPFNLICQLCHQPSLCNRKIGGWPTHPSCS